MRLFIALLLPDQALQELLRVQGLLRRRFRDLKYPSAPQLHMTVKFLGEVPDETVEDITAVLSETAAQFPPFELRLESAGFFPPEGKPRVVWVSGGASSESLFGCARRLETEYSLLGFAPEKRGFTPHITIARAKRAPFALARAVTELEVQPISFHVESLSLMRSVLKPSGAQYSQLAQGKFCA